VRKLVGGYEDSSIGKAKAACASKTKSGIHSALPTSSQVFSYFNETELHHT